MWSDWESACNMYVSRVALKPSPMLPVTMQAPTKTPVKSDNSTYHQEKAEMREDTLSFKDSKSLCTCDRKQKGTYHSSSQS